VKFQLSYFLHKKNVPWYRRNPLEDEEEVDEERYRRYMEAWIEEDMRENPYYEDEEEEEEPPLGPDDDISEDDEPQPQLKRARVNLVNVRYMIILGDVDGSGDISDGEGGNISDGEGGNISDGEGGNISDGEGGNISDGEGGNISDGEGGVISDGEGGVISDGEDEPPAQLKRVSVYLRNVRFL
jgi:hypothetical protein